MFAQRGIPLRQANEEASVIRIWQPDAGGCAFIMGWCQDETTGYLR